MTDRGVSEVLGYVLAFSIVTITIGVVYAAGFAGLSDIRQAEQLQNMERAFDVLDDNLADLARTRAPSRATVLKLAGGDLALGDPVTISVEVTNTSNTSINERFAIEAKPIVYELKDTEIVYELGSVFRSDNGNSIMLSRPPWTQRPGYAMIGVIDTGGTTGGVGGRTTILLVAEREFTELRGNFTVSNGASVRTNVTIESPRAAAWGRYFEEQGFTEIDGDASDGDVTYQFKSDAVYVSNTKVNIRLRV